MKREKPYKTETELCADFAGWAVKAGWTPYPETAEWDLLLVHADGTQIGVQAKLTFNMKLLLQAVPSTWASDEGPDFRAVLIPAEDGAANILCGALGLGVFAPNRHSHNASFSPDVLGNFNPHHWQGWHFWNPLKRCRLPEYVPDVAAGASGPVQLTRWKVAALRIAAVLELDGAVTRADFKRYGIDHRRWTDPGGWLTAAGEPGKWKWKDDKPAFGPDHPVVYPQVLAELRAEREKVLT